MNDTSLPTHGSAPRLYVESALVAGVAIAATEGQSHYLLSVMRRGPGGRVALFNGRDGEWHATIDVRTKRQVTFVVAERLRHQGTEPDLWLMFAPLKAARLEMMVEKATELGVSALVPVITRRTVVNRVNHRRLEAIVMEAAEQCERLTVPTIAALRPLDMALGDWPAGEAGQRRLFFLDEGSARDASAPPAMIAMHGASGRAAILVGPEGGFDPDEQRLLRGLPYVSPLVLGPRILRAETAALAALTCWQAAQGDWGRPS
ncbi:MAG: 16S rRNA (uracil(1498)-N(3))-methyltransferase [Rhodospirillaceae bacterium]|nr:MAG: 16S rRNA (uracil(1498)-N(3))-methyltransferase [Rhodospirillaceae bacterium]